MVRILIADDDRTIRMLLTRLLREHPSWEICGEAENGREAVAMANDLHPDVVVMDLAMPGMNGLQAAQEISRANPAIPLLLLSVQEVTRELVRTARYAGFRGAVTKCSGAEVIEAIQTLLRNEMFFATDHMAKASGARSMSGSAQLPDLAAGREF